MNPKPDIVWGPESGKLCCLDEMGQRKLQKSLPAPSPSSCLKHGSWGHNNHFATVRELQEIGRKLGLMPLSFWSGVSSHLPAVSLLHEERPTLYGSGGCSQVDALSVTALTFPSDVQT